jgi:membrane protein DedA with SNARE-associated domain
VLAFLQRIGEQVGGWFYLVVGAFAFAEAAVMVGLVLPGETALLVAGLAAHQGWIDLWPMVVIAVCCAVLGDTVGYEVGRWFGPRLRSSRLGRRAGEDRWRRADDFLRKYGGRAVLLGRFTAVLRALMPGLAGMARMPYLRTFLPWNVAGGVIWGAGCVLLGYGFSASLGVVAGYLAYGPLVLIAVALAVFILIRVRSRRRHRAGVPADRDRS